MKVAIITSHVKTRFFHGVAVRLEKAGHEVCWLSPSHKWAEWLAEQGVARDRLLDIEAYGPEWAAKPELTPEQIAELTALEEANGWTMKNMILMDRILSQKPTAYAMAYLWVCQRELRRFLTRHGIQAVFLEATWAFELMAVQVCKQLEIPIVSPQTTRIPDGRFTFFEGQHQNAIAPIRTIGIADRAEAREFYAHFRAKKPKPSYFHLNNKVPTLKLVWIRKFVYHLGFSRADRYNETRFPVTELMRLRLLELANTWRTRQARPFVTPELPPMRPFVLLTLHKQPESSIDVLGPSTSNQLELIVALARTLPATHDLYVKEHSNAIGDRTTDFYHRVQQLPGVLLIDPYMNAFQLLEHASLVVTVSGTIAYEAALLGVPAMALVPMYFDPILALKGVNPFDNYGTEIQDFLSREPRYRDPDIEARISYLAWLMANSFPGVISDPESDPACMEPGNLDRVAEGFLAFMETLAPSGTQPVPPFVPTT